MILLAVLSGAAASVAPAQHVGFDLHIGIPAPVVVREEPPRVREERIPPAPGPGYVWLKGHYTWAGNRWAWVQGTWSVPPQPNAVWVEGVWDRHSRQWVESHWEVPPPPPPPPAAYGPPPGPPSGQVIYAEQAPPPPPVEEVVAPRPGPDYVWIGGFYSYERGRHVWHAAHWERPPHGHAVWVEPRWEHREGRYVFTPGFWR